jgi:hypothetical protein
VPPEFQPIPADIGTTIRYPSVVFKPLLLVLIFAELKPITPALSIPVRLDQTAALQAVPDRQRLAIAGEQPSGFGVIDPYPSRPEDPREQ